MCERSEEQRAGKKSWAADHQGQGTLASFLLSCDVAGKKAPSAASTTGGAAATDARGGLWCPRRCSAAPSRGPPRPRGASDSLSPFSSPRAVARVQHPCGRGRGRGRGEGDLMRGHFSRILLRIRRICPRCRRPVQCHRRGHGVQCPMYHTMSCRGDEAKRFRVSEPYWMVSGLTCPVVGSSRLREIESTEGEGGRGGGRAQA